MNIDANNLSGESFNFPDGWKWPKLGDLCDKITDGTHHSPVNGPNGRYKYITAKNIRPWGLDLDDITYVDEQAHREIYSRCDVRKNDVLYVKDGVNTGMVAVNPLEEEFSLLSSVGVLRPSSKISPKYLMYALQCPQVRDAMLSNMAGVAIRRLTLKKLKEAKIPLAPREEQEEIIAEIEKQFSRLHEAVTNLYRVKANLKRYKAAVLKAAVEGRLIETEAELARREGRTYETGAQLLQRILETRRSQWKGKGKYKEPAAPDTTELPDLPEWWEWATVEQLNLANRPCAYGVLQPGEDLSDGVLLVRVGDINDGRVETAQMKRVSPKIASQYPRTNLAGGEFLITLVGAIGRTAVVPEVLAGANVARAVGVVPLSHDIVAHWIEIWFRNPAKVAEMTSKSHEVARRTLNLEDVRAASVGVPPKAEQRRIAAEVDRRFSVIQELQAQVEASLTRTERLRQSVLALAFAPRLFIGRSL